MNIFIINCKDDIIELTLSGLMIHSINNPPTSSIFNLLKNSKLVADKFIMNKEDFDDIVKWSNNDK